MNNLFQMDTISVVDSNRILYTPSSFARSTLLHLQEIGRLTALHPHMSSRSSLQSYLFLIIMSGSGELDYDGQQYELLQGECAFIDCEKAYMHNVNPDDLWTLNWIHFDGPNMSSVYNKYRERGGAPVFRLSEELRMTEIIDVHNCLMDVANSDDYMRDMVINQELSRLLTIIMSESWHPENQEEMPKKRSLLLPIKQYLDDNYGEKISLDDLAEHFYINKYYLSKAFKEQYGISVNNYLLSVRITKAKQMLRFADLTIEQIGMECGLGAAHYFSAKFKEVEGVPPSVYRDQWTNKK